MIVLDAAPIDVNAAERSLSSNSSPAAAVRQSGSSALLAVQHCHGGFPQRGKLTTRLAATEDPEPQTAIHALARPALGLIQSFTAGPGNQRSGTEGTQGRGSRRLRASPEGLDRPLSAAGFLGVQSSDRQEDPRETFCRPHRLK
ncbi:hypothetical protein E2C01_013965 [Portunus trituberculatus]|uniref:Uncharacterized protein n=1 Tax=Portunus trituberculatus TaxID=210409 RepID=A0A5B7DIR4_PORTR|nr:hypothetical protein [Portunus trituberculatus]